MLRPQLWWSTASPTQRAVLLMLVSELPPSLPLLLLAHAEEEAATLLGDGLEELFGRCVKVRRRCGLAAASTPSSPSPLPSPAAARLMALTHVFTVLVRALLSARSGQGNVLQLSLPDAAQRRGVFAPLLTRDALRPPAQHAQHAAAAALPGEGAEGLGGGAMEVDGEGLPEVLPVDPEAERAREEGARAAELAKVRALPSLGFRAPLPQQQARPAARRGLPFCSVRC